MIIDIIICFEVIINIFKMVKFFIILNFNTHLTIPDISVLLGLTVTPVLCSITNGSLNLKAIFFPTN